jgi:hypothetical protein
MSISGKRCFADFFYLFVLFAVHELKAFVLFSFIQIVKDIGFNEEFESVQKNKVSHCC